MIHEYLSHAFEKWKSHARSYNEMEEVRKEIVRVKYSDTGSFDLDKFNGKKFNTKVKLCNTPEGLWENHKTYSFNKVGLPIIQDMQHVHNNETWSGYFVYTVEETRYVEFEHNDFICTVLTWIEWHDGKKRSLNSIRFQYGAAEYLKLDIAGFVEHTRSNETGALIWSCEIFHYDEHDNQIQTADKFYHSPGVGFFKATNIYTYSADGKLETIRSENPQPDNTIRTTIEFSRSPKGETIRSLTGKLTERISTTILKALQQEKSVKPIMQLEMCYRSVDRYVPSIMYATEEEVERFEHSLIHGLHERFFGSQWMKHNLEWEMDEETERLYVRFLSSISESENWDAGENMMCLVAKNINAKAIGSVEAYLPGNFFCYAIDYELDCSDLERMLIKCGVSKSQVAYWKKTGRL